jgi:formate-dependent nitrite reductase membrane component NrfD
MSPTDPTEVLTETRLPWVTEPEPAPLQAVPKDEPELWQGPTYYGLPALKPPPWKGYVPAYLYVGGLAGASAVLAGVAPRDPALRAMRQRARWVAAVGVPLGTALLVADMRRPERFLHMLRVFRPTSVINLGSWLLLLGGTANVGTLLPGRAGQAMGVPSALAGALIATYTGALLSNTAVPLWNRGRRTLPFLFAASSAGSTGWLLLPMAEHPREEQILRRLAVGGTLVELAGKVVLQREVGPSHALAALHRQGPGFWWKASKVLGAAAVAGMLLRPRQRWIAAALGTAAAVASRFAVHEAGLRSAKDPKAAFEPKGHEDSRRNLASD